MRRSLQIAMAHLVSRTAFGRRIVSFQTPRFRLVDIYRRIDGLSWLVYDAAWRLDRGDERGNPAAALAWIYAHSASHEVARNVHQVMGAMGFQNDIGLPQVTGAMAALRLAIGTQPATELIHDHRDLESAEPASTVLGGFRSSSPRKDAK
jgi:alkylation response protein AidB-like acyl-CoA dehydrogenase